MGVYRRFLKIIGTVLKTKLTIIKVKMTLEMWKE